MYSKNVTVPRIPTNVNSVVGAIILLNWALPKRSNIGKPSCNEVNLGIIPNIFRIVSNTLIFQSDRCKLDLIIPALHVLNRIHGQRSFFYFQHGADQNLKVDVTPLEASKFSNYPYSYFALHHEYVAANISNITCYSYHDQTHLAYYVWLPAMVASYYVYLFLYSN